MRRDTKQHFDIYRTTSIIQSVQPRWLRRLFNNFLPSSEITGRGDSLRWPRNTLYPLKWTLTSPTSGGRSVGIVRFADWNHRVCLLVSSSRERERERAELHHSQCRERVNYGHESRGIQNKKWLCWLTVKLVLALASTVILGSDFHETHEYIVMNMRVARQRFDKRVRAATNRRSNRRIVRCSDLSSVRPEL
jgi:hypothetical protein